MENVIIKDGIGYAKLNAAVYYTDTETKSPFTQAKDIAPVMSAVEWAYWGDNNDEPSLIAADIEGCGVLSAAVDSEARLAVGRGLDPYLLIDKDSEGDETLEWV